MAREVEAPAWAPPPRDGVGASRVRAGSAHASVLDFLQIRFPAVHDWPARLERGDVLNAQGQLFDTRQKLAKARLDTLAALLKLKAAAGSLSEDDVAAINTLLD